MNNNNKNNSSSNKEIIITTQKGLEILYWLLWANHKGRGSDNVKLLLEPDSNYLRGVSLFALLKMLSRILNLQLGRRMPIHLRSLENNFTPAGSPVFCFVCLEIKIELDVCNSEISSLPDALTKSIGSVFAFSNFNTSSGTNNCGWMQIDEG